MLLIQVYDAGRLANEVRSNASLLTIGRDEKSAVVLNDQARHISRLHATLERVDGSWQLTVHSRVNPVLVDGQVMRTGQTRPVADGSRITMSPFELVIDMVGQAAAPLPEGNAEPALAGGPAPAEWPAPADGPAPAEGPAPASRPALAEGPALAAGFVDAVGDSTFDEPTSLPAKRRAQADASRQGVAAFLRGSNLGYLQIPDDLADEFLEQAGAVLQALVEAQMQLMLARSEARRDLQANDSTKVSGHERNPLRMISNPAEAVRYLIDPARRRPDLMLPVEAVQDAAHELQAHEAALVAGMRASVLGMLRRFDPDIFEKTAARSSGPLALNRRANAWEALVETYTRLERESADSIDRVCQRDFLRAYAEQLRALGR